MQGAGLAAGASLAGAFVAVASAAAAARIVIAGVSEEMGRIDELSDAANKLGITFADLASLQLGLGQASGLDAEGVRTRDPAYDADLGRGSGRIFKGR